jgi:hypothetical protein
MNRSALSHALLFTVFWRPPSRPRISALHDPIGALGFFAALGDGRLGVRATVPGTHRSPDGGPSSQNLIEGFDVAPLATCNLGTHEPLRSEPRPVGVTQGKANAALTGADPAFDELEPFVFPSYLVALTEKMPRTSFAKRLAPISVPNSWYCPQNVPSARSTNAAVTDSVPKDSLHGGSAAHSPSLTSYLSTDSAAMTPSRRLSPGIYCVRSLEFAPRHTAGQRWGSQPVPLPSRGVSFATRRTAPQAPNARLNTGASLDIVDDLLSRELCLFPEALPPRCELAPPPWRPVPTKERRLLRLSWASFLPFPVPNLPT